MDPNKKETRKFYPDSAAMYQNGLAQADVFATSFLRLTVILKSALQAVE